MYKLIVSIVPHDCGELLTNVAKEAGAGGGTIIMGRGTASNGIIQLLGLGDTSKDIVLILVDEPQKEKVLNSIITTCATKKAHFGVLCTVSVNNFIKAGSQMQKVDFNLNHGDESMENSYQMINVIVNKGYAEDAMDAARKAGAGGGTIIGARGTAREGDAKFFGMEIVPEKEMLMILVPSEKAESIVNAIRNLECFSQAGSGIIFCNQAMDFTLLGKK